MVDSKGPHKLQARLQELLADKAFSKKLLAMEKPENVQEALEEKGVELSLDEVRHIGKVVQKVQAGEISQEQLEAIADGELSEDELVEVAGGSIIGTIAAVICSAIFLGGSIGGGIYAGVRSSGW